MLFELQGKYFGSPPFQVEIRNQCAVFLSISAEEMKIYSKDFNFFEYILILDKSITVRRVVLTALQMMSPLDLLWSTHQRATCAYTIHTYSTYIDHVLGPQGMHLFKSTL